MHSRQSEINRRTLAKPLLLLIGTISMVLACPFNVFSENPVKPFKPERHAARPLVREFPDSLVVNADAETPEIVVGEDISVIADSVSLTPAGSIAVVDRVYTFNPDPARAVWLSALFPGLGQLYNRRYWKLPVIVGGFMGLGYATSWNNSMLRDYSRAYADIMDSDPATNSYMDFFPPTTTEADINTSWLTNVLKSRKDYYRRNRDLCVICIVGVYLLAMVDAYVDAQLSHFDISPNLSMDIAPTLIPDARDTRPGVGMLWALNF